MTENTLVSERHISQPLSCDISKAESLIYIKDILSCERTSISSITFHLNGYSLEFYRNDDDFQIMNSEMLIQRMSIEKANENDVVFSIHTLENSSKVAIFNTKLLPYKVNTDEYTRTFGYYLIR